VSPFWYSLLDENYIMRIYSSVPNRRDARVILRTQIGKDVEEFTSEISEKMEKYGTASEQDVLKRILYALNKLIPKRSSLHQQIPILNLLRDIINLWAVGTEEGRNEAIDLYQKELKAVNPKFDPHANALFHQASIVYKLRNERASRVMEALKKYNSKSISLRGKKVVLRKGVVERELKALVDNAQPIGYNEALKEANRKTLFRDCFIPPDIFTSREIALQNAYKNFRSREAKREMRKRRAQKK